MLWGIRTCRSKRVLSYDGELIGFRKGDEVEHKDVVISSDREYIKAIAREFNRGHSKGRVTIRGVDCEWLCRHPRAKVEMFNLHAFLSEKYPLEIPRQRNISFNSYSLPMARGW